MYTQITLAIALLLAPCDAVHLRQKAAFPKIPISGPELATALGNALEGLKGEVSDAMYKKEKDCWGGKGLTGKEECYEYERGLRRDLKRLNRDAEEIGFTKENTYDPLFITNLIEAEYADVVSQFQKHSADIGRAIDQTFRDIEGDMTALGLAQKDGQDTRDEERDECRVLQESFWQQQKCDKEGECPGPCCWRGPNGEEEEKAFDKYWQDKYSNERKQMNECYMKNSELVRNLNAELPPAEYMVTMLNHLIGQVAEAVGSSEGTAQIEGLITQVNSVLTNEASRLNVALPESGLPNPQDTTAKLAAAVAEGQDAISSERGQRELLRELSKERGDILREAYQTDREITRELGAVADVDPQALLAGAAKELPGINRDAAHVLNGIGLTVTEEEIGTFTSGLLASATTLAGNHDTQHAVEEKLEGLAKEAEHMLPM